MDRPTLTAALIEGPYPREGAVFEDNVCRVFPFLLLQYIARMLWRSSRGRPLNAPAAFIHPCQPIVAREPPQALHRRPM
jgi:hypothetical protein